MRCLVAALLAILILTIACADPLFCADGCDRGGIAVAQTAQTGSDCPTCLSAVLPQFDPPIAPAAQLTPMCQPLSIPPLSRDRAGVDHPPRLT